MTTHLSLSVSNLGIVTILVTNNSFYLDSSFTRSPFKRSPNITAICPTKILRLPALNMYRSKPKLMTKNPITNYRKLSKIFSSTSKICLTWEQSCAEVIYFTLSQVLGTQRHKFPHLIGQQGNRLRGEGINFQSHRW